MGFFLQVIRRRLSLRQMKLAVGHYRGPGHTFGYHHSLDQIQKTLSVILKIANPLFIRFCVFFMFLAMESFEQPTRNLIGRSHFRPPEKKRYWILEMLVEDAHLRYPKSTYLIVIKRFISRIREHEG